MRDIQSNIDNNDEISLMELLQILINEKITILITFIIVLALSIVGILYYNSHNININTYLRTPNKISKKDILNDEILRKIYMSGDIDTTKLSFFSYKNKFKVEELLPKKDDKIEKVLPFKNYILKFNYKSREKSKKILNLYINELKEYNIIKNSDNNLYPLLDEKILENNDYSYNDLLTLVSNKSKKIYQYLNNNKKTFSNFNSFQAQDIALKTKLDNLMNIDIKNLDYYILSCNFIKSEKLWKEQYNYRLMTLTSEIKSKQIQALDLKKMLNEFKLERSNNSQRNEYYLNLINKYVDLEFKIVELKSKMKQLQNINSSFTIPDKKQTKYINGQFNLIFQTYNKIVTNLNKLIKKHNIISSNNMYTIVVPPTSMPTFNMYLSFIVSVILAFFVALLSGFIKHFFACIKHTNKLVLIPLVFISFSLSSFSVSQNFYIQFAANTNPDNTPIIPKKIINDFLTHNLNLSPDFINNNLTLNSTNIPYNSSNFLPYSTPVLPAFFLSSYNNISFNTKEFQTFYLNSFAPKLNLFNVNSFNILDGYLFNLLYFNSSISSLISFIDFRINSLQNSSDILTYKKIKSSLLLIKNNDLNLVRNFIFSNNIDINYPSSSLIIKGKLKSLSLNIDSLKLQKSIILNTLNIYKFPNNTPISFNNSFNLNSFNPDNNIERGYVSLFSRFSFINNSLISYNSQYIQLFSFFKAISSPSLEQQNTVSNYFSRINSHIQSLYSIMISLELHSFNISFSNFIFTKKVNS